MDTVAHRAASSKSRSWVQYAAVGNVYCTVRIFNGLLAASSFELVLGTLIIYRNSFLRALVSITITNYLLTREIVSSLMNVHLKALRICPGLSLPHIVSLRLTNGVLILLRGNS